MNLSSLLKTAAFLFTTACLAAGCGWHLRGFDSGKRPEQLALVVENRFEPLVLTIQDVMRQNNVAIQSEAPLQLHVSAEQLSRRTVAVTSIGSALQYELTLSVHYRYSKRGDPTVTLPQLASATRVFDFDPSNTVAKNEEENTLIAEMRQELAIRLLNNIPADYYQQ